MARNTNIAAAVLGCIIFGAVFVLCWRLGLLASFTLQSLAAWLRSRTVDVVPPLPWAQRPAASNGGNVLPLRLGPSPSVIALPELPSAYGLRTAGRQGPPPPYSEGNFGTHRGASVVAVSLPLPPSYTVSPGLDDQSI